MMERPVRFVRPHAAPQQERQLSSRATMLPGQVYPFARRFTIVDETDI
tara:strand:- start:38 stop:181 length:144 start_codon:yes stop_codon:yes gene_type:complete